MPQEPSLSERILRFLKKTPDFICGGEIQVLAVRAGYEGSNAARRLRELASEGLLEVEHRKGNNGQDVSWYKYKPQEKIVTVYEKVKTEDGEVVRPVQKTLFV